MEVSIERIEAEAARQAVDHLFENENLFKMVKEIVDRRINEHFQSGAEKQIADAINEAVKNGFNHSYSKVDSFGRPIGEPTTILKEIEKHALNYWTTNVDANGKPTENNFNKTPRALWFMTEMCAKDFEGTLKQQIVNTAGALKDGLRANLNAHVGKIVDDLFRVRTDADKASPFGF